MRKRITRLETKKKNTKVVTKQNCLKTSTMTAYQMFRWIWDMITTWISGSPSTTPDGKCTGTHDAPGWSPAVKKPFRPKKVPNGKPPLVPKRRKKKIPAVIYIDDDYWEDIKMLDPKIN